MNQDIQRTASLLDMQEIVVHRIVVLILLESAIF
jgi:hypothetical protein